jgi:HAD superfamily hydrolase (TIGR01509 family)
MMKTRALIFDVDGTLVDTEELHRRAFNQVFLDFKLAWKWPPDLYAELLKVSGGADRIEAYIQRLGIPESEKAYLHQIVPMMHREKTLIYAALVHDAAVRPRGGVARLIGEALHSGVKVSLVSTSAIPDVRGLVSSALGEDVAAVIDPIVCADHVANKKPAPDLYLLALNMLRLGAEDCVAFEDSANGLAAAKGASLYTVVTPSRWTATQDFRRADLLLSGLGDPDHLLDSSEAASIGGRGYLALSDIEALRAGTRGRIQIVAGARS